MRVAFLLAWAALLSAQLALAPHLPEVVGPPGKQLPRHTHVALMLALDLLLPWLSVYGGLALSRRWPAALNMPHKAFWLAPERRADSFARLQTALYPLGLWLIAVLALVQLPELLPLWPQAPQLPREAELGLGLLMALLFGVWIWRFQRQFGRLPPAQTVAATPRRQALHSRSQELVWREAQPVWGLWAVVLLVMPLLWWQALPAALPLGLLTLPLLLGRLLTEVRGDALVWRFGWLGWPRWRLPLDEIVAVEPARSSPLEGWGIRFTNQGMLYNAHGLQAVRLTLRSGRQLRLGSAEPARLIQALQPRIGRPAP